MEEVRRNWPFLRDRRIDAYGPIVNRFLCADARGYRMPAEWEPHEATWIAWPHNEEDWPGRFAPIPWVYGEIVRKLSQVERVRILVQNDAVDYARARSIWRRWARTWKRLSFSESRRIAFGRATSRRCSCATTTAAWWR